MSRVGKIIIKMSELEQKFRQTLTEGRSHSQDDMALEEGREFVRG